MTIKIPAPIHLHDADTQHQFNARESDWAFTSSMPFCDRSRGYLVDDTVISETEVLVPRVVDYSTYDSKKETGFVGLKNQGATCYMNSLLQTLYHIPSFREAVYLLPTTENDMPSQSILVALQRIFYELQYSDKSVATEHLIKSFGWNTYDSYMQHDVQELNRFLCNKLEDSMKGTVAEGTMQKLFEGHRMNYIECLNVDCKSSIKDSFYDIQLDVKGCLDVYASLDNYVKVERLEGDNKYDAEQNGLQDANKHVLFIDFPPVLQLQLKRFEYNSTGKIMNKINDRYEFPMQLDLDRENGKYLSPEADRSVRNLYILHSVLVHSGGVHGGHYYASIRPSLSDHWYKFDDERVTKENIERALEEQYGGEEETKAGFNNSFKFTKYSSAYMLVYTRESVQDDKICNIDPARMQFTFNSFPHLPRLRTKGTTILMFAEQDNFFILVDSRETLTTTTDKFILNEHLKKYELFGNSAFATFAGHIHIGQGVLEHMAKNTEDLSIDNLALTASNYCPKFTGDCEIYIGGLLPNGEPRLYRLFIKFDKLKVEKTSKLKPVSLPKDRKKVAYGTGSLNAREYLDSHIFLDVNRINIDTRIALLMAALWDVDTGGSSNTIHLTKGRKSKVQKKSMIKCFEEHYDLIMKMKTGLLFILYNIHELNANDILNWIQEKQTGHTKRKTIQVGSPLAKIQDHDLVISCLEVHEETGKMLLKEGSGNTIMLPYLQKHLLGNGGFRGFSIQKENKGKRKLACKEANLFLAQPSKAFLRALKIQGKVNEFLMIPDSDKNKYELK